VVLAGSEEVSLVGKVVVDRQALHAGSPCNLGHRCSRRADLFVKLGRRSGDSLSRRGLPLGPLPQLVRAFLT